MPSDDEIERKTDSLRPGAAPEPLAPDEVTGVIDLACLRLQEAQTATSSAVADASSALEAATARMEAETARAVEFAKRVSSRAPATKS
jgi:hypothetical protein